MELLPQIEYANAVVQGSLDVSRMLQGIREWSLFCFGEIEGSSVCPMVRPGKRYGISSVFAEDGGYPPITEDMAQQLCNSNLPVIPDKCIIHQKYHSNSRDNRLLNGRMVVAIVDSKSVVLLA